MKNVGLLISDMQAHIEPPSIPLINDSEWGTPSFDQPKPKTNRVGFLSKIYNLNMQLKCKLYPMPKIREIFLNLEGF